MYRVFSPWLNHFARSTPNGQELAQVLIHLCRPCAVYEAHTLWESVVCTLWEGRRVDEDIIHEWTEYTEHICRHWNAIAVGAYLTGLDESCPAAILADAVEEKGDVRLAQFLRHGWACGTVSDPNGNNRPKLPDIPIVPNDWLPAIRDEW